FTSPIATDLGWAPTLKLRLGWKAPSPLPKSTLTLLLVPLVTARSRRPSPLTSPTATEEGESPTPKLRAFWKEPSPLPKSTLTVAKKLVARVAAVVGHAQPGEPAAFNLPPRHGHGPGAGSGVEARCGLKIAVAVAQEHAHVVAEAVGHGEVEAAVAVELSYRQ